MNLKIIKPFSSLNRAHAKVNLSEEQILLFKENFAKLFERLDEEQTEEHLKNIVADFLKNTYYKDLHEIDANGRQDLVIHHENTAASKVGVILEVKRPKNKAEMISLNAPNKKALQELLLYYLQERENNKEIKHLIATNIYEWYIFDAAEFERLVFENKSLQKEYQEWKNKTYGISKTEWFYQEIAKPFIENELSELSCTHFHLNDIQKMIESEDEALELKLIDYYKIFSPEHLLKKAFQNDANILNQAFYNELLYILGLEEVSDNGGKKLIKRVNENDRQEGSFLEECLKYVRKKHKFVPIMPQNLDEENTPEEAEFEIALELCITWINRILFLKLLEAQLVKFNRGDKDFAFLNLKKIADFDDLNDLFFEVLSHQKEDRIPKLQEKYWFLPYLNSSLFEETKLEIEYIFISNFRCRLEIPIYQQTVLKEANGEKTNGTKGTLEYLFSFLDAYNFESDSKAIIQKTNKTIINAAVLGLIFEKINGYKEGSFFTPAFISMFMSREAIRKAVLNKFNQKYKWNYVNFEELKQNMRTIPLAEANAVVNSLKICDPAVGSGHFLVSALNEIIALKSDLGILCNRNGARFWTYTVEVVNDELEITNLDIDIPFEYFMPGRKNKITNYAELKKASLEKRKHLPEWQMVQEALFHEKQTIIENCLFGVDINPKSVMICRLRLWIELLKNMYYTPASNYTELETLPNIDINIKRGNSLVYRFDIKDSYAKMPAGMQQKIQLATRKYKEQVIIYKNTSDKATKKQAENAIARLKEEFSAMANPADTDYRKVREIEGKLAQKTLDFGAEGQSEWLQKVETWSKELDFYQKRYDEKRKSLYGKSFEWRFEFPEVLNENGEFVGFDLVIGNPPYIRQEKISVAFKEFYLSRYQNVGYSTANIYVYFFGLAMQICTSNGNGSGLISFITLNQWLKRQYGTNLRLTLAEYALFHIVDFFELRVFESASTDSAITFFQNEQKQQESKYFPIKTLDKLNLRAFINGENYLGINKGEDEWKFVNDFDNIILDKLQHNTISLKEYTNAKIYYGIKTGANEVFIIPNDIKNEICKEDPKSIEIISTYAKPRNVERYSIKGEKEWFIHSHNGILLSQKEYDADCQFINGKEFYAKNGRLIEIFRKEKRGKSNIRINRIDVKNDYPAVYNYFLKHKDKLMNRNDKGEDWTNLRNCDYIYEFYEPKIIYLHTAKKHEFYFDFDGKLVDANGYFISTKDKYLWAYLNSELFNWFKKIKFAAYGDADEAGRSRLDLNKMETVPVKLLNTEQEVAFEEKVSALFALKKENPDADVSEQEKELNRMIYEVYDISEEQQKIIET